MRISDWSSDVCSSDLIAFGEAFVRFRFLQHVTQNVRSRHVSAQTDEWNRLAMTSEPVIASRQSPAVNGAAHARGKPCIDPGLNITCMGGSARKPLGQHPSCHVSRISNLLQMRHGRLRTQADTRGGKQ